MNTAQLLAIWPLTLACLSAGCLVTAKIDADAGADSGADGGAAIAPPADAADAGALPSDTGTADASDGGGAEAAAAACWHGLPNVPAPTGPSGTNGGCSLVGTWDYEVTFSSPKQPKMVWAFDDHGRAVGGPAGTNLCAGFLWYGNYTLDSEGFAAVNIRGSGAPGCGWSSRTTFTAEFSADCRTLTLPRIVTDGCTGGALFYVGKMTRID